MVCPSRCSVAFSPTALARGAESASRGEVQAWAVSTFPHRLQLREASLVGEEPPDERCTATRTGDGRTPAAPNSLDKPRQRIKAVLAPTSQGKLRQRQADQPPTPPKLPSAPPPRDDGSAVATWSSTLGFQAQRRGRRRRYIEKLASCMGRLGWLQWPSKRLTICGGWLGALDLLSRA